MLNFNLRFLFGVVTVCCGLTAGWMKFPAATSMVFVVLASVTGCWLARDSQVIRRWLASFLGTLTALLVCIFWEYLFSASDEVHLGLSRAIPGAIFLSMIISAVAVLAFKIFVTGIWPRLVRSIQNQPSTG